MADIEILRHYLNKFHNSDNELRNEIGMQSGEGSSGSQQLVAQDVCIIVMK
ncbi:unnamed protein product [Meloidogyne enterolobii]|uniref:Uncharacterized protein n=1 Tax=Meloidogyne enterolobii TaxID=390850 RepID=A0ACB0XQB9_MELEN